MSKTLCPRCGTDELNHIMGAAEHPFSTITDIDTRHLRTGDRVLVTPGGVHNRFHRAMRLEQEGTEWRTVSYTTPVEGRPEMRNWRDVVFTEGGWAGAPASSTFITDISGRDA